MKIGVWLGVYDNPKKGGGFYYVDKLISAIDSYQFNPMIEICFVVEGICSQKFQKEVIELSPIKMSLINRALCRIPFPFSTKYRNYVHKLTDGKRAEKYGCLLKEKQVRLLYYIYPFTCVIPNFPFIITNWDIGHCSTYAFPEVALPGTFSWRANCWYRDTLPRALSVFAESEAGKRELVQYTTINASKIKVVPIFSGDCVKQVMPVEQQNVFLDSHRLRKEKFFFYPAQFWAHKNHIGLLKAFSIFLKQYPDYKLVLTGSDKGTLSYVLKRVAQLKLNDAVIYLGFVSTEEMNTLYQNATSLVMPSYMGPTNMPPLEALELGCPVICSDLTGHREELGEAAIYFNPMDSEEISNAMISICLNRDIYANRIKEQAIKTVFTIENALRAIDKNLCEAIIIRDNWE